MPRVLLALAVLSLAGIVPASAQELTVSVAISMKEAIEEIGGRFAGQRPAVRLRYNVGASGELQKQIEAGAQVDVFVSAGARPMDELERGGLLLSDTRRVFASNVLIAVKPVDETLDLPGPSDLLDRRVQRIALGDPKTVSAGQYAEESLRTLKIWERLRPRIVLAESVGQVLDYVVRSEVEVGVVYATDALTRAGRVRLAFAFPAATHAPIVHTAAVVKASRYPELARAFTNLLAGSEGQLVLRRLGFEPPGDGGR